MIYDLCILAAAWGILLCILFMLSAAAVFIPVAAVDLILNHRKISLRLYDLSARLRAKTGGPLSVWLHTALQQRIAENEVLRTVQKPVYRRHTAAPVTYGPAVLYTRQ